jgi:hypothetical protein
MCIVTTTTQASVLAQRSPLPYLTTGTYVHMRLLHHAPGTTSKSPLDSRIYFWTHSRINGSELGNWEEWLPERKEPAGSFSDL